MKAPHAWCLSLVLVGLCSCDRPPDTGDLNLVAVGSYDVVPLSATAAVDSVVFTPCGTDDLVEVFVGFRLNLLQPEPVPVPVDTYCRAGVRFASDPFDGALRIQGELADGTVFRMALDPGLATRSVDVAYEIDTEGILALDADLLFSPAQIDAIAAEPSPIDLAPDHPISQQVAAGVGDALVWLPSPDEAARVYVDLWPGFDFSISARMNIEGCRAGPMVVRHPDASTDGATPGIEDPIEPGDDPANGGDGGDDAGDRGSGCGGGSGCGSGSGSACGSGCSAGCDADCSSLSAAPFLWGALLALGAIRRRRRAGGEPPTPG